MLVLFSHSFPFSIRKNYNRRKFLQIVFENKKRKKKKTIIKTSGKVIFNQPKNHWSLSVGDDARCFNSITNWRWIMYIPFLVLYRRNIGLTQSLSLLSLYTHTHNTLYFHIPSSSQSILRVLYLLALNTYKRRDWPAIDWFVCFFSPVFLSIKQLLDQSTDSEVAVRIVATESADSGVEWAAVCPV
jgi:hypothetical protein